MPEINAMGTLNNPWGVCGFTSALYALYENNAAMRIDLVPAAKIRTRMIAEIKSFLVNLQADGNAKMLSEIQSFTSSFEDFKGFTIAEYIRKINEVAISEKKVKNDFSIGMPPDSLVEYLKYIGFRNAKILNGSDQNLRNELLLGVADPDGKLKNYGGLAHWVYMKNGIIYSWGRQFPNIAAAGFQDICSTISPHG